MLGCQSETTAIIYNFLAPRFNVIQVVVEDRVPALRLMSKRVKKLGLTTALGQLAFVILLRPLLRLESHCRVVAIKQNFSLDSTPIPEVAVRRVESVNTPETVDLLAKLEPDIVIVNVNRIISRQTLETIRAPFINIHMGITPLYRGVHGGYWALVDKMRDACGVTVHCLDHGIDTGRILAQTLINPIPADNFVSYPVLQLAAGLGLLDVAARRILDGSVAPLESPRGPSKLWSHPTLWGYLRNRWNAGVK